MLRDSKRKSAINLFVFPVMPGFVLSPSELSLLKRNSQQERFVFPLAT